MPAQTVALHAFNRGRISRLGLARVDVEKARVSAEIMTNFVPRVLGSMMLRPGLGYIGATQSNAAPRCIPFVFATSDTALLELTDSVLRVWVSDALVTRNSVASAVTNGNFNADIASWTDNDEAGGVSVWVAGGYMGLTGNGTANAIRDQTVTVAGVDQNVEHGLKIVIQRGPVICSIGSTVGGTDYFDHISLETGTHSLAFTPSGNFSIRFQSLLKRQVLVDSCNVEAAGVMTVATPWAAANLSDIRYDQSGDVVYVACKNKQQYRIERRSTHSWGVARYAPEDGPLMLENTGPTTITPSALTGNITLTASASLWRSTHVGALFRITSKGQTVTADIVAENTFTNTIRVTGVGAQRAFTVIRSGRVASTITLQRSLTAATGPWTDVASYTTNATVSFNDGLDNQIAWYQIGVKTGDYVAAETDHVELHFDLGGVDGIVRLTAFSSATSVSAEVIVDLGATTASDSWAEGSWSDYRGWPTADALHQGRLWWAGKSTVWGSVSDLFASFDENVEGDSGPLNRTIGIGPVDVVNWLLAIDRLMLGAEGNEISCRSTVFDDPLTPTNFNLKAASGQGSAGVQALKVDNAGIYVQRGGTRMFELAYNGERSEYDSIDLTAFIPEICQPSIVRIAVQRQPDTRVHCVRSDGTVAMLVFDKIENVLCWCDVVSDGASGLVEDVVVLPGASGSVEDRVYYVVKRTINGVTVRYLEKWALESECRGAATSKNADSFIVYSGAAATVITGLSTLEGASCVVWADGIDVGAHTVSGGQITLAAAASNVVVGLPYTAQWKSSKLAYAAARGTALEQPKRISHIGVILADAHYQGIQYGRDFDNLDNMPLTRDGVPVAADTIYTAYDENMFEFDGLWDTDSRICLQAAAPRPVTCLALVFPAQTEEKV